MIYRRALLGGPGRRALASLGLTVALALAAQPAPVRAQDGSPYDPPTQEDSVKELESGRILSIFPHGDIVAPYIADPHAPDSALSGQWVVDKRIESTRGSRIWLRVGGRFGLLRRDPAEPGGRRWQFSLDAGIDAVFDVENSLDNIGWDGNYGLSLTTTGSGPWGYRFAFLHTSSHIGDEYIQRTGRERIGYTRGEWLVAVTRIFRTNWRAYGEVGYSVDPLPEAFQEALRLQTGLEWQRSGSQRGKRWGRYAALDLSALEELDFKLDAALQTGLVIESGGRRWRIGVELYNGRVPIGEFYRYRETAVTVGLWADL
jgi:hypothetical protein